MTAAPSSGPVLVLPSDPGWVRLGAGVVGELVGVFGESALFVDHIGSTAIPGMAAKPVLDLQVAVADLAEAERRFAGPLAELGFDGLPYRYDHVPAGVDDDPERWAKRFWRRRGHPAGPDCNLHVRVAGGPNTRLALLFRDWFRHHPEAVPAYARFKSLLADAVPDLDGYADVKDPVVDLVIAVAEPWAAATGWAPHAR
ncbi:GrpB family protein [Kitasatospora sp. NPDC088134]|uniref:GrpB family protein n=1 Tax=Kitasatospora sp. NPDC088134 TaxID=3364071 RepID=UPI00382856CC